MAGTLSISKNQPLQVITLPATSSDINAYLAVGYDGELPSVAGSPIAGVLDKKAYANKTKAAIRRGESFITLAEDSIVIGDLLWADTDGKFQKTATTEIPCAIAQEAGDTGDIIRAIIIPHGTE